MRDGALDVQALVVQRLELLVVLLRRVHLDLERVDLQQLRALLQVVVAVVRLTAGVQLLQYVSASTLQCNTFATSKRSFTPGVLCPALTRC